MSTSTELTINIDGAARGNPGPAAYGYVIARSGLPPIEEAGYLGHSTNNVAEYTALVKALERAATLHAENLLIRSDSELLVKQMNGIYRVKNPQLQELHFQASELRSQFAKVSIHHVRREGNARADELCNEVLDAQNNSSGAARTSPKQRRTTTDSSSPDQAREEALTCLRAVASAWAHGDAAAPKPEEIWDQLWSILEEHGLLRPSKSR